MSGRLIILPKKSYCPWKPENVEKVLRDERLERERLEQLEKQNEKEESRLRLQQLKKSNSSSAEKEGDHFNLFAKEESEMMQKTVGKQTGADKKVGIMPVALGQTELKNRGENLPFYMRQREASPPPTNHKEMKRKARMDPMQQFSYHERTEEAKIDESDHDRRERRRHRKESRRRRSHHRKHKKHKKEENVSIDELRKRREERERVESERARTLVKKFSRVRSHHYQDQYNPSLSRN